MKKAVATTMDFGAQGIKLRVAGRLNGAEISRAELTRDGKTPLHTLRAHIDYGFHEANTLYGKIGVKCWICKRELAAGETAEQQNAAASENRPRGGGRGPRGGGDRGPRGGGGGYRGPDRPNDGGHREVVPATPDTGATLPAATSPEVHTGESIAAIVV